MGRILAHWVLSALCLLLVAHFVPGFVVSGFGTALIAAVVIGLVNGTLGMLLKIVTFPLTILTFGIFWLVINALDAEGGGGARARLHGGGAVAGVLGRIDFELTEYDGAAGAVAQSRSWASSTRRGGQPTAALPATALPIAPG